MTARQPANHFLFVDVDVYCYIITFANTHINAQYWTEQLRIK